MKLNDKKTSSLPCYLQLFLIIIVAALSAIPGIILFVANGVLNIPTAIIVMRKGSFYPQLVFFQGCILSGWIAIQVFLVRDFNWMQFLCGAIGLLFTVSGVITMKKQGA